MVSFRVTDGGDPVAGARKLRTDGHGEATVNLKPGNFRATTSKAGNVSATRSVRST